MNQHGLPGYPTSEKTRIVLPHQKKKECSHIRKNKECSHIRKKQELDGVFFDFTDVTLAIENIPNGASPGPDGVPPCLLKKAKVNIARMILIIWQESYETGTIPDILKLALVSPIHKGGSRAEPS